MSKSNKKHKGKKDPAIVEARNTTELFPSQEPSQEESEQPEEESPVREGPADAAAVGADDDEAE